MPTIRCALVVIALCMSASCKRDDTPTPDTAPAPATSPATEAADEAAPTPIPTPAQVKQLTLALCAFSQEHHGDFTAEQRDLGPYIDGRFDFVDRQARKPLYIFQHWVADQVKKLPPAATPIVWTNAPDDTYPLNVGYLDGHVESHANKFTVNKQLEAAKNILMGKSPPAR